MAKSTRLFLLATVLLTGATIQTAGAANKKNSDLIANVNGTMLKKIDFSTFVSMRAGKHQITKQQLQQLLAEYINRELIYQDALKKGYDKAPEVLVTLDNQRRNIVASYNVRSLVSKKFSEQDLRKIYQQKMSRPTQEYKASHILVKSEKEARDVIAQLKKGKDFATLARQKSLDSSSKNGGNLGWFSLPQMTPPFQKALKSLKAGNFSKEPLKSRYGWHIILLESTRKVPPPPFDTVKEKIRGQLQNEILARYLNKLRAAGKIKIFR